MSQKQADGKLTADNFQKIEKMRKEKKSHRDAGKFDSKFISNLMGMVQL